MKIEMSEFKKKVAVAILRSEDGKDEILLLSLKMTEGYDWTSRSDEHSKIVRNKVRTDKFGSLYIVNRGTKYHIPDTIVGK